MRLGYFRKMTLKSIIVIVAVFLSPLLASAEALYVRSLKAPLKSLPLFSAKSVSVLKQGERVDVVERKGGWVYVTSGSYKGWLSVFFTSSRPVLDVKPVLTPGKSGVDLSGKGRRRASSYTTSAARGLYEERARSGKRRYKPDFSSLSVMESYIFSEEEVTHFLSSEGLK